MGAVSAKIVQWYNKTAQAAYYYPFTRFGFGVSHPRAIKGAKKAAYFGKGLVYLLIDPLRPPGSHKPCFSEMQEAFATAGSGLPSPKELKITPSGAYVLDGISFATGKTDGKLPRVSAESIEKVYGALMGSEYGFLSMVEIAESSDLGLETVSDALRVMIDAPLPGMERVLRIDDFVCLSSLSGVVKKSEFQAAVQRKKSRSSVFYQEIAEKVSQIKNLPTAATPHQVLTKVNEKKGALGLRHLDVFLFDRYGSARLEHQEVLPAEDGAEALLRSVVNGENHSYTIRLGGSNKDAKKNIRSAGLELKMDKSLENFLDHLRERGIEEIILCKALAADRSTQAILVFSNPLLLEKEEDAMGQLNHLAKAVGRTLGKIRDREKSGLGARAAVPIQEKSKVPKPGDKDYGDWRRRNAMAMSRFYNKAIKIFAHICRLSRAYQTSVLEGIEHVFDDIKERWEGPVAVVDAGVGTAYFLERFLSTAKEKGVPIDATAIDLSETACAIAKDVCGDQARVTKGNIASMTRFLEDVAPIQPGSQKLVFLNYVLQYAPIEEVLMDTNRVLEKGGRVLITNFKPKKSMRWNEFWTNVRASWDCGKNKTFGRGRLYEMARFFLLFFKRPFGIVKFAMDIDRDVRKGIIPENPDLDKMKALLENHGFNVLLAEDTHYHAAIRLYAEKVSDLK